MSERRKVDASWTDGVDVTEMTDTDIVETRTAGTSISDPSHELRRLADGVRDREGFDTVSDATDYSIRVYLAYLMDAGRIEDLRDEYDVAYLIPPSGWSLDYDPEPTDVESVSVDEDGKLYPTMPPSVKAMVDDVVEMGDWKTIKEFVADALAFAARQR